MTTNERACLHQHRKIAHYGYGVSGAMCEDCGLKGTGYFWEGFEAAITTIRSMGVPLKAGTLRRIASLGGDYIVVALPVEDKGEQQ